MSSSPTRGWGRSAVRPSSARTGAAARSSTGPTRRASCRSTSGRGSRFGRRRLRARGRRWHDRAGRGVRDEVLARLRADGPLTTGDLGGAKASAEWWDWSHAKVASSGCSTSATSSASSAAAGAASTTCPSAWSRRRCCDLRARRRASAWPRWSARPARALGVATVADLAEYHRLTQAQVRGAVEAAGLVAVAVDGWGAPAWADPAALAAPPRGRHRTTLLSPFDSLIFDRARAPSACSASPTASRPTCPRPSASTATSSCRCWPAGSLVGRVDPKREGSTLVARQLSVDDARRSPRWPRRCARRRLGRLRRRRRRARRAGDGRRAAARGASLH